jgi:TonB family protein
MADNRYSASETLDQVSKVSMLAGSTSSCESRSDPSAAERRRHDRRTVSFGFFELDEGNGGIILNVGLGGLCIQAARSVSGEFVPKVRFQLGDAQKWGEVSCRIAWASKSKKTIGLVFETLSNGSEQLLRNWLNPTCRQDCNSALDYRFDLDANNHSDLGAIGHNQIGTDGRPTSNGTERLVTAKLAPSLRPSAAVVGISGFLLIAIVFLFVAMYRRKIPLSPTVAAERSHMNLHLEHQSGDLRLSWNPNSAIIVRASKAHLLIADGPSRKFVDLDSSDLQGGSIIYTPLSQDVTLTLEVDQIGSSAVVSETTHSLGPVQNSPTQAAEKPVAQTVGKIEPKQLQSGSADASQTQQPKGVSTPSTVHNVQVRTGGSKGILIDDGLKSSENPRLPSVDAAQRDFVSINQAPPRELDGFKSILSTPNVNAPPNSIPSSSKAEPIQQATNLIAAQLIEKQDPVFPAIAKQVHASGTVEVEFHIGTDGKVHDINVVRGTPVLAHAAVEAVRRWRYNPARLNGAPVETDGRAILKFE